MSYSNFKKQVKSYLEQKPSPKGLIFETQCDNQIDGMFINPSVMTAMFAWKDNIYYIDYGDPALWININSEWAECHKPSTTVKEITEQVRVLLNVYAECQKKADYLERYDLISTFGNLQDIYSLNAYPVNRIYNFEFYQEGGNNKYSHEVSLKVLLQCADQVISKFDINEFNSHYIDDEDDDVDNAINLTLGVILSLYLVDMMFPDLNYEGESFIVNDSPGLDGSICLLYDVFDTPDVDYIISYMREKLNKELEPYI